MQRAVPAPARTPSPSPRPLGRERRGSDGVERGGWREGWRNASFETRCLGLPPPPAAWPVEGLLPGCRCPRAASRPLTSHPPRQAMPPPPPPLFQPARRCVTLPNPYGPARHPPRLANAAKPGTPAGRRENDSGRDRLRSKSGARLGSARRAARLVSRPRCARGGASLPLCPYSRPSRAGRGATSWPVGSQSVSHSGRDTTPRATSA